MKIFNLNGEKYYLQEEVTLYNLFIYFNYNHNLLVLEYNQKILNVNKLKTTLIQHNDNLEIITIVGGG